MSFIPFLNACLNSLNVTAEDLIHQDIIRIEKILKAEIKMESSLNINYLNTFLDAVKNNKNEWLLLFSETYIVQILQNQKKRFFKSVDFKIDAPELKIFLEKYLKQDLIFLCENAFKNSKYHTLIDLIQYKTILPNEVIDFIERKSIQKLDYLILNLKKGYYVSGSKYETIFLEFTSLLDAPQIKQKKMLIIGLSLQEANKTISTPGFILFLKQFQKACIMQILHLIP